MFAAFVYYFFNREIQTDFIRRDYFKHIALFEKVTLFDFQIAVFSIIKSNACKGAVPMVKTVVFVVVYKLAEVKAAVVRAVAERVKLIFEYIQRHIAVYGMAVGIHYLRNIKFRFHSALF